MRVSDILSIAKSEFDIQFARSSGAGGQNVNKVESKAVLIWSLFRSNLPFEIRHRLSEKLRTRLTSDGRLILTSQKFRDQIANRRDVVAKFEQILEDALHVPKSRKPTKPTRSSQERRLKSKSQHKQKKSLRGRVKYE